MLNIQAEGRQRRCVVCSNTVDVEEEEEEEERSGFHVLFKQPRRTEKSSSHRKLIQLLRSGGLK